VLRKAGARRKLGSMLVQSNPYRTTKIKFGYYHCHLQAYISTFVVQSLNGLEAVQLVNLKKHIFNTVFTVGKTDGAGLSERLVGRSPILLVCSPDRVDTC
jgi:hypothetical protein